MRLEKCARCLSICLEEDTLTADRYLIARVTLEYPNEIINPVANDKRRV